MSSEPTKVEMIWNEANMFARDIITSAWIDVPWNDLPKNVQEQFTSLVSGDVDWSDR